MQVESAWLNTATAPRRTEIASADVSNAGEFAGRRVLVTGAASGIGRATAEALHAAGAELILIDRDEAGLESLRASLGGSTFAIDLADEGAIRTAVDKGARDLGGIDGVANVAGIGGAGRIDELSLGDWDRVLRVNLTAPMLVVREALPHLKASFAPAIVNVSSGQGLLPSIPGLSPYCASKGGLVTLTKAMAIELAPIRVNVVCPGVVDTPLIPDSLRQSAVLATSPYALKRLATPEEIAEAILFLIGPRSSFITGVALAVDGGRTYH